MAVLVASAVDLSAVAGAELDGGVRGAALVRPSDSVPQSLPVIVTQPTDQTVSVGGTAVFHVVASGSPEPTLGWMAKLPGASAWSALTEGAIYSGIKTDTLTVTGVTADMNGTTFWCTANNISGPMMTNPVTLTVTSKIVPKITWPQPAPLRSNLPLSSTQLNATADVPGHFTYSPVPNSMLSAGTHRLTATFTPDDTATYSVATAQVTLTVTAADYSGTYFGTFGETADAWALQVQPDNSAFFVGFSARLRAVFTARFTLGGDGRISATATEITSFLGFATEANVLPCDRAVPSAATYTLSGLIAAGHVGGGLDKVGLSISGDLDSGLAPPAGSYYTANTLGVDLGSAYAVVSPSGRAMVAAIGLGITDAALGYVDAAGKLAATGCWGGAFTAIFDRGSHAFRATLKLVDSNDTIEFGGLASDQVASSHLVNLSARAYCGAGNNVTIGGFVINGAGTKRVLIRAIGPSLSQGGLDPSEILADPKIELHRGDDIVATNDDWGDNGNSKAIVDEAARLGASSLATFDTKSSALLSELSPGVYSFVIKGGESRPGIVLLEIYDANPANTSAYFSNISARAYCTTGNGVTIGGFVVTGNAPKRVLLRGVGPTLAQYGVPAVETLADPAIELHSGSSTLATNDNANSARNGGLLLPVGSRVGAVANDANDYRSSALLYNLQPGAYSFIASGVDEARGIVLIEVFDTD